MNEFKAEQGYGIPPEFLNGKIATVAMCFWCKAVKEEPWKVTLGHKPLKIIRDYVPCCDCLDLMNKGVVVFEALNRPYYLYDPPYYPHIQPPIGEFSSSGDYLYPSGRYKILKNEDVPTEGFTIPSDKYYAGVLTNDCFSGTPVFLYDEFYRQRYSREKSLTIREKISESPSYENHSVSPGELLCYRCGNPALILLEKLVIQDGKGYSLDILRKISGRKILPYTIQDCGSCEEVVMVNTLLWENSTPPGRSQLVKSLKDGIVSLHFYIKYKVLKR